MHCICACVDICSTSWPRREKTCCHCFYIQNCQGVQLRMVLVVNFFEFLKKKNCLLFCAIFDLVHDVKNIVTLPLTAYSVWKSFLKYE